MKHYTAPEGVWLPVDEESILATADSGTNLKVGEDKETGWGKLIQIGRLSAISVVRILHHEKMDFYFVAFACRCAVGGVLHERSQRN